MALNKNIYPRNLNSNNRNAYNPLKISLKNNLEETDGKGSISPSHAWIKEFEVESGDDGYVDVCHSSKTDDNHYMLV